MEKRAAIAAVIAIALAHPAAAEPRHTVVVEALGKGGLWGAGYELGLAPRLRLGAVGSYYQLGGDRYTTLAPYLAAYPLVRGHHSWFAQVGPQLVHRATPSPVREWSGMSTTAVGAELSSGYEYRRDWFARVYAMASIGTHAAPWLGVAIGWSW